MNPIAFFVSMKARFAAAKAERTTRGHSSRRIYVRHGQTGQIVGDPPQCPSKQHRCICGSGRKYGKCCKRAFVDLRAVRAECLAQGVPLDAVNAEAGRLQGMLTVWRLQRSRERVRLLS